MTAKQRYALIMMGAFLVAGCLLALTNVSPLGGGFLVGISVLWSVVGFGPPDGKRTT